MATPDVKIAAAPGIGHFVASRTVPGCFWLVSGLTCTCPATTPSCWHKRQVHELVRSIENAKFPPLSVGKKADPEMFVG